ncbi:hypothetical protein SAMN04488104_101242 [Algoriphagus faecimaris]|uniref:Uncharacterized protein n=1 Tax=Algoriphagus faecimaris TaxID=686796 RepID=A0A1G6RBW1_9BACT|nr:hypothetical protein [Algoriphagus faecimaris]SDD02028.1 hypothetical protein SAMN04488104_101242 [Algoriphagus faecimaris]
MKYLISVLVLTFGVILFGFAQEREEKKLSIEDLKKFIPPLKDRLSDLDFGKKDSFLLDSASVFIPKTPFLDREMSATPRPSPTAEMPIYRFPETQSTMPIKKFEDSIHYTLRIKEFK